MKNMHIFGTVSYAYVQSKKKLDARSDKEYFLVMMDKSSLSAVFSRTK